ncbi:hypothetical protein ACROYT_G014114 [Oculina patagonica]
MKELEQDPEHYKNYMRMDLATFQEQASLLHPLLKKCDTRMQNAISPSEQLSHFAFSRPANHILVCNTSLESTREPSPRLSQGFARTTVELESCRKALETIERREDEMMAHALDYSEAEIKEERERKLKRNALQAKHLSAKIKQLNRELEKTIKEIGEITIS